MIQEGRHSVPPFHSRYQQEESDSSSLNHMNACVMINCICPLTELREAQQAGKTLPLCVSVRAFPEEIKMAYHSGVP